MSTSMKQYFCDEVAQRSSKFEECLKQCILNRFENKKMCEGCRDSIEKFLEEEAPMEMITLRRKESKKR